LEHGFNGWDTDLISPSAEDGTRIFLPSAGGFLGTRIGWIGHGYTNQSLSLISVMIYIFTQTKKSRYLKPKNKKQNLI
jgi:hypothetical protein